MSKSAIPAQNVFTSAFPKTSVVGVLTRGMATDAQLKRRIKSVASIRKITKAMKMVAASKLKGVQSKLDAVRIFQKDVDAVWPAKKAETPPKNLLVVPTTSDRGLCGGVNSAVVKAVKELVPAARDQGRNVSLFLIGEKGKAALERLFKNDFAVSVSESGKQKPVNFRESSLLAEHIVDSEYDEVAFLYNRFKSAIAFTTTTSVVPSYKIAKEDKDVWKDVNFDGTESEILSNLYQYRIAVMLYHMAFENATSEQSARMTAMENSSKSANEMLGKLQLLYNRSRQTKITTNLIEIISGAIAAEEMGKK